MTKELKKLIEELVESKIDNLKYKIKETLMIYDDGRIFVRKHERLGELLDIQMETKDV